MKKILSCIALSVLILCVSGCDKSNKQFNKEKGVYESSVEIQEQEIPVEPNSTSFDLYGYDKNQSEKVENSMPEIVLPGKHSLIINEVAISEFSTLYNDYEDSYSWIELKNDSESAIYLSDYYISDDINNPQKYQLPHKKLAPNQLAVIASDKNEYSDIYPTGFYLDAKSEELYLSDENGFVDFIHIDNIPVGNGSCGRMENENEVYYFSTQSPLKENENGKKFVSEKPKALIKYGVFNGIGSISASFTGEGKIYYTVDGSIPDENSTLYTSPILLNKTTVIRTVAVQDGGICSHSVTIPYIINENHTFPVVSIVTDDPQSFKNIYDSGNCKKELSGNIVLFENGEIFNINCGISIDELSRSQTIPKKSLNIQFRTSYGQSLLRCDLFGNGMNKYTSLTLEAGQDSSFRMFNSDMWQELAYSISDNIISQHAKPVVVYLNGEYYGIYSMKEKISAAYYAGIQGVSEESVSYCDLHNNMPEDFEENVYHFIKNNDMSQNENYEKLSERLDIDSFIDYCIIEGVSANDNLTKTVKAYRSSEGDGKWRFVLCNLEGAVKSNSPWKVLFSDVLFGQPNRRLSIMLKSLLKNEEFKEKFLKRYSESSEDILTNDNIISVTENYRNKYLSEIERDRTRWGYTAEEWNNNVDSLEKRVVSKDWKNCGIENLCVKYLEMSDDEIRKYFPDYQTAY